MKKRPCGGELKTVFGAVYRPYTLDGSSIDALRTLLHLAEAPSDPSVSVNSASDLIVFANMGSIFFVEGHATLRKSKP